MFINYIHLSITIFHVHPVTFSQDDQFGTVRDVLCNPTPTTASNRLHTEGNTKELQV